MRNNIETYKVWAPDDALWTQWAKPVLFIRPLGKSLYKLEIPKAVWLLATYSNKSRGSSCIHA